MLRRRIYLLFLFILASCAGMPLKSATPMAPYSKLMVRDVNWKETALSELGEKETGEFIAAQPVLTAKFRNEFAKYITMTGFFDKVSYGNASADSDTLVLEPKIYTMKAGGFMPGASYTGMLTSSDGRRVATYTAERRLNRNDNSGRLENIEQLVTELAEDAASMLPFAR